MHVKKRMIPNVLTKLFGSRNDRLLRQYRKSVEKINALEPSYIGLSDEALRDKTQAFKDRFSKGETLDALLPEAFAVCREGAKRSLKMRHFDVQLVGGMVLHDGKIAEMRTGEGKTLTSTLAVYLNALAGQGLHVVTVNDYLAGRDAEWMGKLYNFLGLTVGVIFSQQETAPKREAYACDITYGTNNEFGFDYLRDNMEYSGSERRQRSLFYAIVDEVDSILIDEARTPLIISGQAEDHTELYQRMNAVPKLLKQMEHEPKPQEPEPEGDFWVDLKGKSVHLSEAGHEKAESLLAQQGILTEGASLYDPANISLMHHLMASLRAHCLFHRDQEYVVQNGEVMIVDEFTGRLMVGRRWSDGLHQAVEAKEGVTIQAENQTLASITFQNFFRMYAKLAGMTGTADTEAYEFQEIYKLETVVIPTHRAMVRIDRQDQVFRTEQEKHGAIIGDIQDCYQRGQPVLVGTTSVESSEFISGLLTKANLPHQVLNAKQHAREAEIVAEAGRPKQITIATNMAGRGTDIVLGGNVDKQAQFVEAQAETSDEDKKSQVAKLHSEWQSLHDQVLAAGGLHIVGTERHESRRIDNQLRGRSGRQGDAGSSRFFLSMDDTLLKIFAGERLKSLMDRLKLPEGEPIEAGMVTRSIESAQRKVEARNFDIRKQLLEYDDVANDQRKIVYADRNALLDSEDLTERMADLHQAVFTDVFRQFVPADTIEEQWDLPGLQAVLKNDWQIDLDLSQLIAERKELSDEDLQAEILKAARAQYQAKIDLVGKESWMGFERSVLLQTIDQYWREHLSSLDYLRQGIHLRGYAQKNPKQEYKREAFELFTLMQQRVRDDAMKVLMTVRIQSPEEVQQVEQQVVQASPQYANVNYTHADFHEASDAAAAAAQAAGVTPDAETIALALQSAPAGEADDSQQPFRRFSEKVGRNDPCPCGSGKKFKQCHGKLA